MEWTRGDVQVLRQCVFEEAYDFEKAAALLHDRLPKKRYASLSRGMRIDGKMCEKLWYEHCGEEAVELDVEEEEREDYRGEKNEREGEGQGELRLELPLSDNELDMLLGDINDNGIERSEMQWVLSYLDDPSNAVDTSDVLFQIDCQTLMEKNDLSSLDAMFEQSRVRSQTNKSYDNIPGNIKQSNQIKDTIDEIRTASVPPPAPISHQIKHHTTDIELPADFQGPSINTQFSRQNTDEASIFQAIDYCEDSSDDDSDWNHTRRAMKAKAKPLKAQAPSPLPSVNPNFSDSSESNEERSERLERERMKLWKEELERQDKDLGQEVIALAEKARIRQEFASLLQGSPTCHEYSVSNPKNEFEISTNYVVEEDIEIQKIEEVKAPITQVNRIEASVVPEVLPKPKVNSETQIDRELHMKSLIERSITSGDLCEPLYHRQFSHKQFIPTLPLPYWKSLFSCEFSESERIPLSDIFVFAMTVDLNDDIFADVLSFILSIESQFMATKLLGIIYTVASEPLSITQLPPTQADPLSKRVLYFALQTTESKSIIDAQINAFGIRISDVCIQLPSPPSVDAFTLAKEHPIHIFTRLPAFQVYHNKLKGASCSLAPETTVCVLAPPFHSLKQLLQSSSSAGLDIVGCKLCTNAGFEPDLFVPQEITSSTTHLAFAFRGQITTAKLRDIVISNSITAYVSHGVLQSKRDLVHWFGGRVACNYVPLPAHLPHPRQLYSLILQPEETIVVALPPDFAPALLGRILDAVATCGYNLVELKRLGNGTTSIALAKENGRGKNHTKLLNEAITDITAPIELYTTSNEVNTLIERCKGSTLPIPRVGPAPTLFVDYEREQTLLAIIPTGAIQALVNTQVAQNTPQMGQILSELLQQADVCHLLGLKLAQSTQAICDFLASMMPTLPRETQSFSPTGRLLFVVFRQLVPNGNFKKAFERIKSNCVLYAQPTVVHALITSLFDMDELYQHRQSHLDLCYPEHCLPCFQVQKTAPLDSIIIIKPATNVALLPLLLRRLQRDNFTIVEIHMTKLSSSQVCTVFGSNQEILDYMTSQPCVVILVRRCNAISRLIELVGPPDPEDARENARFSLIAGYGVDLIHNAIYTPPSYLKAQADIKILYNNSTPTDLPIAWRVDNNPRAFIVTPKTLVETTLVLLTGPLVKVCGTILPWFIDEGEFRLVNLQLSPSLSSRQKLYYATRLSDLDGPCIALALERDNAVSRMISFLQVSPAKFLPPNVPPEVDVKWWTCSMTSKDAVLELPQFFQELHGSVHSITNPVAPHQC